MFTCVYGFVIFLLHAMDPQLVKYPVAIRPPTDRRTLAIWKRQRTALLVGLTGLLLVVLAVLQNRWVNELSEFQFEQMERSLQASTRALSRDFGREFRRIRLTFFVGRSPSVEAEIIGDYRDWIEAFEFPHLIGDAYWIDQDLNADETAGPGPLRLRRVNFEVGLLEPVEWPDTLKRIREGLANVDPVDYRDRGDRLRFARGLTGPVDDDLFGMVVAQDRSNPSWAVALLRNDVLIDEFIPFAVEEYFGPDETRDYDVWIVDEADETNVIYASNSALPAAAMSSPDIRRGLGDDSPDWEIVAKHRSGSLQVVIDEYRTRNLSMSVGVVIVLGVSFGFLLVATRRAQWLAERQMEFVAGVSPRTSDADRRHFLAQPEPCRRGCGQPRPSGPCTGSRSTKKAGGWAVWWKACCNSPRSAPDSTTMSYDRPISAPWLTRSSTDSTRPSCSQFSLERDIGPDVPAVLGDEQALRTLVRNLVSNSMKFSQEGDEISVVVRPASGRAGKVELCVQDSGYGIDHADLPHIFKPFYRGTERPRSSGGWLRAGAESRQGNRRSPWRERRGRCPT